MRTGGDAAGVPLRKSLLTRLLAASLLIAMCALSATAWLAVQTTSSVIRRQSGQALTDDITVYRTLMDYAATHPRWDGVERTVAELAARTHRRITLRGSEGRGDGLIADSSGGDNGLPSTQALAVVDPLQTDPALIPDARADRIHPKALGPFRLQSTERRKVLARVQKGLLCLREELHFTAALVDLPGGHPRIHISGSSDDQMKGTIFCNLAALEAPTPTEIAALGHLNALIKDCLQRRMDAPGRTRSRSHSRDRAVEQRLGQGGAELHRHQPPRTTHGPCRTCGTGVRQRVERLRGRGPLRLLPGQRRSDRRRHRPRTGVDHGGDRRGRPAYGQAAARTHQRGPRAGTGAHSAARGRMTTRSAVSRRRSTTCPHTANAWKSNARRWSVTSPMSCAPR